MEGTNLNSVQLGSFLAALGLLLGAFLLPWLPIHSLLQERLRILPAFRRVAQRRICAILLVGLIAFAGDALVSWRRPPLPVVPDEFSYLLAADTFASGRLTNPTPARWQHFETPEVLVRPTYQSKYPPGQGLFLALGQLAGKPLAGVWLSSALACAALCWMLQAWVGETWALYGALLAACQLAFFGHWAQSYWGGMVAALGGALLYGAVRRIADHTHGWARLCDALWLALGLIILANTRPFEGLLAAVPAGIALLAWPLANRSGLLHFSRQVLLPAAALLLLGTLLTLTYNQRVTGSAWQLPYQVYERQYDAVPGFIFQPLRPWPQLQDAAMTAAAVDTLAAWRWAHGFYRVVFITSKVFGFWQFAFGAALSLPFVMLVWAGRWRRTTRIFQVIVFATVQGLAVARFLFWPSPSPLWILLLLLALLGQAVLLVLFFTAFWERIALLALGLVVLGLTLETWRFHSHYIAPVIPLAVVLFVQALRRSWAWTSGTRAPGKVLTVGLPVLTLAIATAASTGRPGRLELWAQRRADMERRLASLPGRQLIIVHYEPQHDFYEEWVENRADVQHAEVIWARERSPEENCLLIASYPGRAVWLFDADRDHLEKYIPDCAGGPKTQPSAPILESLPEH